MEYVVVTLLVIILLLLVILILKISSANNNDMIERLGRFQHSINQDFQNAQDNVERKISDDFIKMNSSLNDHIYKMNESVNQRINENFKKTNETFGSILERLSKIDEAQKKIDSLSTDIVSLQSILSDKTIRGSFGEVQLKNILVSIFGETSNVYSMQYTFSTGSRVDAIIFAPEPINKLGIDSKFPLENYRRAIDKDHQVDSNFYFSQFKKDLKKHVDDIANKYIIPGETTQAIMFIPAEAVFAYIQSSCLDVVEYANNKSVWMTSPTTLIATLTTIQVVMKNLERDKFAKIIQEELTKLSVEFDRYMLRFDKLNRSVKTLNKDIDDITITSNKISKRFNEITNVEIEHIGDEDEEYN